MKIIKTLALLSSILSCLFNLGYAEDADKVINAFYANPQWEKLPLKHRLEKASAEFLGKPYLLGALGEGATGEFDQSPLYRTDAFDCITYTSTVLALAHANSLDEFKKNIIKINYQDGKADFVHRNHFTHTDYNHYNIKNGYLEDITYRIIDQNGKPASSISQTIINKPAWYASLPNDTLKLSTPIDDNSRQQRLTKLHALSKKVKQENSTLLYIPLTTLFNEQGQANHLIFDQIPHLAIVEIVRPQWPLEKEIGTQLDISHLGFAIRKSDGLYFRQASSIVGQVADVPLVDYLKACMKSPTIKGIHILKTI